MPLYKTITVNPTTKVLIWKIDEPFEQLSDGILLTAHCQARVDGMMSDLHRRGFMSIRHLLAKAGYVDHDLYYDEKGKPHLRDGTHISITHSYTFSALILSDTEVGIDIEMQRPKILKIAHKFTSVEDYRTLANEDAFVRKLTIVWGAKESVYKSFSEKGLSFLQHIDVDDFNMEDLETTAEVSFAGKNATYRVWFFEFEGFTCTYAQIVA